MASILDRYGIKEVADLTFYQINSDGTPGAPVLYIDTAKVSTMEQTADNTSARGGKGNPELIMWDYGKEINVTVEDALFSPKSMAIMFGDGTVTALGSSSTITKTATVRVGSDGSLQDYFFADIVESGKTVRKKIYMGSSSTPAGMIAFASSGITLISAYKEDGTTEDGTTEDGSFTAEDYRGFSKAGYAGQKLFIKYSQAVTGSEITITGDSFPGTYYVTADTYARSDVSGNDEFFQLVFPKAKMQAENTITMSADGDPSTFNMNLRVLRPDDGEMVKLIQYELSN